MERILELTGNTNDFTIQLEPQVKLDEHCEAAMLSLVTYYSIPNITNKNNIFRYYNGKDWKTINLGIGSYEITAINEEIQREMKIHGDFDKQNNEYFINIFGHAAKLKSILHVSNKEYKVDFSVKNSIGSILGFNANDSISYGYNESPNIVDISPINAINVNVDFVSGFSVNGRPSPTIYSFFPKVSPGYKIIELPNPTLIWHAVTCSHIDSVRVWFTDQNNELINFRGERITTQIAIRKKKNVEQPIINAIKKLKIENIL